MKNMVQMMGSKAGDSDIDLEMEKCGPITDLENIKSMAEAIETAKKKLNFEVKETSNVHAEESLVEISNTIDDSVSEFVEEEVLFPPIKHESSMSEDSADELEQIHEQILMDNNKSVDVKLKQIRDKTCMDKSKSEEDKIEQIREQLSVENEQYRQACGEIEKIQLQILVDNLQAAETPTSQPISTLDAETPVEPSKEPAQPIMKIDKYAWKESETLPKGWKIKKTRKMSFVKELFLSPKEYIFCSRREALKSLIENQAENDEIECMRSVLKHEGWKEN